VVRKRRASREAHDPGGGPSGAPAENLVSGIGSRPLLDEVVSLRFRLERLQRVSRQLGAAVTVEQVVAVAMDMVDAPVPSPARGLWLRVPGADELELVAASRLWADTAARFARIPLAADLPGAIALRERRTVISTSRTQAEADYRGLEGTSRSAEGFVAVPLLLDGVGLGVLGLGYDQELTAEDISFLEAVADQIAQTLARVRLAEQEQRRRAQLEFLTDLTDAALRAEDYAELMRQVTSAAVPMLGDWCSLHFLPEDGGAPHVAVAHVDPEKVAWAEALQRRFPYDADRAGGIAEVIRTGETQFLPDLSEELITDTIGRSRFDPDELRPIIDAFALTSVITVPLLTKRRVVGAMQFISAESGRRYNEHDVALAEAVAGRLAEPLDSAWLNDQHRSIAVTLQRALLPPRLPRVPGVDIAARYWPAGGAEVGGDFYDLFAIDPRSWAVVIGDACGTGPNAAALTSIARHTVRAAARHGAVHTEVMDWLNEAVLKSDRELFCTACYATLIRDGDGWLLRSAAAGHPLPILASPGSATEALGRPGTLLGAFDAVTTSATDTRLGAGDTVVFYTDGVTDLPPPHGLTPDDMIGLVASLSERRSAADVADAIHASVLERVPEPQRRDDIALVVLRIRRD
jgi:serine phosphatase RsbU (regulator of sigma subunit)